MFFRRRYWLRDQLYRITDVSLFVQEIPEDILFTAYQFCFIWYIYIYVYPIRISIHYFQEKVMDFRLVILLSFLVFFFPDFMPSCLLSCCLWDVLSLSFLELLLLSLLMSLELSKKFLLLLFLNNDFFTCQVWENGKFCFRQVLIKTKLRSETYYAEKTFLQQKPTQ